MDKLRFRNIVEVKEVALRTLGEALYDEAWNLKQDIDFFSMYMNRNKKSKMNFSVKVTAPGTKSILSDLIKAMCGEPGELRPMFSGQTDIIYPLSLYHIYRIILTDIEKTTCTIEGMTDHTAREFMELFKKETGLDPLDYVGDIIHCNSSYDAVMEKLKWIVNNTPDIEEKDHPDVQPYVPYTEEDN